MPLRSVVMILIVMFAQQIFAEIAFQIAPDGVHVIGIVLRIVVLQ